MIIEFSNSGMRHSSIRIPEGLQCPEDSLNICKICNFDFRILELSLFSHQPLLNTLNTLVRLF